jgi:hypothetical protein
MKRLILTSIFLLSMSAIAFGGTDLSFMLNPGIESYPPGADPVFCETNGTSSSCVVFSGSLIDTDLDNSVDMQLLFLNDIYIDYTLDPAAAAYFSIDSTFYNLTPGVLSVNNPPFQPSYTGPIFGVDFDPATTPYGIYNMTAVIDASGGDGDPNYAGFSVTEAFTVVIASPEPTSGMLIFAGLSVIAALSHRARRRLPC